MTYEKIVEKLQKAYAKSEGWEIGGHKAIQVNVRGEGDGALYIEVSEGKFNVQPYEYYDNDAIVTINSKVLIDIIDGKTEPGDAFAEQKFSISGDVDVANKILALRTVSATKKAVKKTTDEVKKAAKKASAETKEVAKKVSKKASEETKKAAKETKKVAKEVTKKATEETKKVAKKVADGAKKTANTAVKAAKEGTAAAVKVIKEEKAAIPAPDTPGPVVTPKPPVKDYKKPVAVPPASDKK